MDKVFVVHGRDSRLRDSLFAFLRSIGLQPLEWSQALNLTGDPAPFIGKVLDCAFNEAKAVVVLITGDDLARLSPQFVTADDAEYEHYQTPQARPNVLFEAGLAFGYRPNNTVLVEIGKVRPFSDIAGRYVVKLDNSVGKRQILANRLNNAGCCIDLTGTHWHSAGDFVIAQEREPPPVNKKPVKLGSKSLENVYLMFGNYTELLQVETQYEHVPLSLPEDIRRVYSFLAEQARLRAKEGGVQYFNGPCTRLIRFSETSKQDRSGYEQKCIKLHFGPVSWEEYTVLNCNLEHVLRQPGNTIGQNYASQQFLFDNDRDLRWCQLSNILSLAVVPITSDGYGLVQARNPKGVSADGNRYTSGIAENIHRYLDEVSPTRPEKRLHPLKLPGKLFDAGIDHSYEPASGNTLNPYLTASRGLWEEISEKLHEMVPLGSYKFYNITFDLDKFIPHLTGFVELGLQWKDVEEIIHESPGKDHSEYLSIAAFRLDPRDRATGDLLRKEWVPGGLAAFFSAIHYWDAAHK